MIYGEAEPELLEEPGSGGALHAEAVESSMHSDAADLGWGGTASDDLMSGEDRAPLQAL